MVQHEKKKNIRSRTTKRWSQKEIDTAMLLFFYNSLFIFYFIFDTKIVDCFGPSTRVTYSIISCSESCIAINYGKNRTDLINTRLKQLILCMYQIY